MPKDTSKLEQIGKLKQLLRESKTILQIQNEMGLSDRTQVLRLIHVATFRIPIYEGLTPDGDYYYGLLSVKK